MVHTTYIYMTTVHQKRIDSECQTKQVVYGDLSCCSSLSKRKVLALAPAFSVVDLIYWNPTPGQLTPGSVQRCNLAIASAIFTIIEEVNDLARRLSPQRRLPTMRILPQFVVSNSHLSVSFRLTASCENSSLSDLSVRSFHNRDSEWRLLYFLCSF